MRINKMLGIYVHFPFCEKKCNYCAFSSFVNKNKEDEYISHLLNEINSFGASHRESHYRKVDTIYLGGGTPSIIDEENIGKVVKCLRQNFEVSTEAEITIECNPHSTTLGKLQLYKSLGINRISFGVQSLNDEELRFLGRLHTAQEAKEKIALAKEVGFDNISADLIIGIKGQSEESLLQSAQELISLGVNHISSYMLQVEEGTPLQKMVAQEPNLLPDDDECVKMYAKLVSFLEKNGFEQYEVSNFAKNGKMSRHNYKYWTGEEYIGFGLGAHSYINRVREANALTFDGYFKGEKSLREKIDREKLIEEHIMLGLRCNAGISEGYLKSLGYDIKKNENLDFFIKSNVLKEDNGKIYLNKQYFQVNNYIIVKLLP